MKVQQRSGRVGRMELCMHAFPLKAPPRAARSLWLLATRDPRWRMVHFLDQASSRTSLWPLLLPEAMKMSEVSAPLEAMLTFLVHAASGDHLDVLDPCCHWKPYGSPWSMLCQLLWERELLLQWYRWLQTHNWEWETLSISVATLPPIKESNWRESLKNVTMMLKCTSSLLMASGEGSGKGFNYL